MKSNTKTTLITFVSKDTREASKNLNDFISMCKNQLTMFSDHKSWRGWDDHRWPDGHFTKISKAKGGKISRKEFEKMDESFIDFAKAYTRYVCAHHGYPISAVVSFLRALEQATMESDASVIEINKTILTRASNILIDKYNATNARHSIGRLEKLAKFMHEKGLTEGNIYKWKSSIKVVDYGYSFVNNSDESLSKKMPPKEAIVSLARKFADNPRDPEDIFITCLWAILISTGLRISEALSLSVDSLQEDHVNGRKVVYVNYFSKKGGGWHQKPIIDDMEPVIKEAFKRIKEFTKTSRRLSRHFELEYKKMLLDVSYEMKLPAYIKKPYTKDQELEVSDLSNILGLSERQVYRLLSKSGSRPLKRPSGNVGRLKGWTISDVEKWMQDYWSDNQPEYFPFFERRNDSDSSCDNLKYSDALFCFRLNELSGTNATRGLSLMRVKPGKVTALLTGKSSFFTKYNIQTESGEIVRCKSHSPRHLYNTKAQNSDLSQWDIARLFGRVSTKQNKVYDHTSTFDRAKETMELTLGSNLFGELENKSIECKHPIDKQSYHELNRLATTHSTEFGLCTNTFSSLPCGQHRNCLSCSKHICVVGDTLKLRQIEGYLKSLNVKLNKANKSIGREFGVERWIKHLENEILEVKSLLSTLKNPELDNGLLLHRLGGSDASSIGRVVNTLKDKSRLIQIESGSKGMRYAV